MFAEYPLTSRGTPRRALPRPASARTPSADAVLHPQHPTTLDPVRGRSAHFRFGTVCINIQTGPLHAGRPRVCWGAEIAKPSRGNRAPARRSAGTSIGSWSRRWLYGSGPFCACAWWAGLASPDWLSLAAGVVDRGGVGWVHRSRAGIGSAGAARRAGAWKGPANYCVSWVTRSAVSSMTLTA